jgi:hypothetical protein
LTITPSNQTKVYGSTLSLNGTEFTSVGLLNNDTISSASLTSLGTAATAGVTGSPYAINLGSAIGTGLANYAITYIPGALTVTQAALTIAALDQRKVYGSSLALTGADFISVGLINGDLITSASLASAGVAATAGVTGSPYTISIGNAVGTGLANYAISYVPAALTVAPAPLTLTALNQSKVYGSTLIFAGTEFSANGLKNGEIVGSVDFTSSGVAPTAGVAGGPYPITISNPQEGTFDPANYAITFTNGSLEVAPASLVITALDQRKRVGNGFRLHRH